MKLYSYWRSGTSYRVRVALALKGAEVEIVPVNLLEGEHRGDDFKSLNPQGLVPSLVLENGTVISQSPAIIEYLEEILPGPKLLPDDPIDRARARQLAALIGCDIHPLQNLRVLKRLQDDLGHDRETAFSWAAHWIGVGFEALEEEIGKDGRKGPFLLGDEPTLPDCYLLPQLYAARRFGTKLDGFDRLLEAERALESIEAVQKAHPEKQVDATS